MKEGSYISRSEVLPQTEAVAQWVTDSTPRFNKALRSLADFWLDELPEKSKPTVRGAYAEDGYKLINGEMVLTGSMLCVEATRAYAEALRVRFPFTTNFSEITFFSKNTSAHTVLGFSIEGDEKFLDGTYGQISQSENTVRLGELEDIEKYYDVGKRSAYQFRNLRLDGDVLKDNKYVVSSFAKGPVIECRGNTVPPLDLFPWEVLFFALDRGGVESETRESRNVFRNFHEARTRSQALDRDALDDTTNFLLYGEERVRGWRDTAKLKTESGKSIYRRLMR